MHASNDRHVTQSAYASPETLRASEARYRALATASADVIYRMSPDWSEIRELDRRGFQSDAAAPSGTWLSRYVLPQDRLYVSAAIDTAMRSKTTFELEHRVARADGTPGWTFSRAVPVLDAEGQIVEWVGAATDVTERKRNEQHLRNSEERFAASPIPVSSPSASSTKRAPSSRQTTHFARCSTRRGRTSGLAR